MGNRIFNVSYVGTPTARCLWVFLVCFLYTLLFLSANSGRLTWVGLQQPQEQALPSPTRACWVVSCFRNPPNSYVDNMIFNVFFYACVYTPVGHTDSESARHFWLGKNRKVTCVLLTGFEITRVMESIGLSWVRRFTNWATPSNTPWHIETGERGVTSACCRWERHTLNGKPRLAWVNARYPPSKNHMGVLSWTCRSQRKWQSR